MWKAHKLICSILDICTPLHLFLVGHFFWYVSGLCARFNGAKPAVLCSYCVAAEHL